MRVLLKGFVADGVGEPRRMAILAEDGIVIAVEKDIYGSSSADRIICFRDEIISPGFIDVHGHSDLSLPASPAAESKRRQGVTCEITGNCGLSAFPLTGKNREHLNALYANYGLELSWDDIGGYRDLLSTKKVSLRTFSLCGHNTLRAAVAGYEREDLTAPMLDEMKTLLGSALTAGAVGMSTGLLYTPGCFAGRREIVALMEVLRDHGAVYATHLRSEGDGLLESLEETLSAAEEAGLEKVEISHLKTAGEKNWGKLDQVFDLISRYREKGMDVRFDRYPYTESQTMLSVILPPPFDKMTDRRVTESLRDEKLFASLVKALSSGDEKRWERWRITGTTHPEWRKSIGKKYSELPGDPAAAAMEMLAFDATTATVGASGMSEENMLRIIRHPLCMPGSDGNALPADASLGRAHPRAFGAVAKFIRLRLDAGESVGSVVRAATAAPAEFFRLPKTGRILPGYPADITVFSPDEIDSKADFTDPHRFADGIRMTMLDGKIEYC